MSPILVRPVREQLEHDRLIRHLQQKYKRKFDVALNLGDEQGTPVKIGTLLLFPDLVLTSGRKLAGVVEIETGESVNNLEAMAQWVHFARSRVPFHLYVPVTGYETARRLCEANNAQVTEVWTYRPAADGFDLVRMSTDTSAARLRGPMATVALTTTPAPPQKPAPKPATAPPPAAANPVTRAAARKPAPPKPSPAAKPARKPATRSRKPPSRRRKAASTATRRR